MTPHMYRSHRPGRIRVGGRSNMLPFITEKNGVWCRISGVCNDQHNGRSPGKSNQDSLPDAQDWPQDDIPEAKRGLSVVSNLATSRGYIGIPFTWLRY